MDVDGKVGKPSSCNYGAQSSSLIIPVMPQSARAYSGGTVRLIDLSTYHPDVRNLHRLTEDSSEDSTMLPLPTLPNLDKACCHVLHTGEWAELCGPSNSGKTQLCMLMALTAVIHNTERSVIYMDTTKSFSPQRMQQLYTGLAKRGYVCICMYMKKGRCVCVLV
jgi:hypothetical protein